MAGLVADYGKYTWAGQHNSVELDYIQSHTGREPAFVEGDLLEYSPSRVEHGSMPANLTESYIALAKSGYALGFCWHWNAPTNLLNTDEEPWYSGFYTKATTFNVAQALANTNSIEYAMMLRDIDAIAVQLEKVSSNNIPVLWRPLHEASGRWFWWGARGPGPFKQLWRLLYHRLTVYHHLHNLIWVLTNEDPEWYPGDDVVDIVGLDAYPTSRSETLVTRWQALQTRFADKKLLTLSEYGGVPDVELMHLRGEWWSYFSGWNGKFLESVPPVLLKDTYLSPEVITLDKLKARTPATPANAR
jgi:mannan endo-1,4-beta-mannosidase